MKKIIVFALLLLSLCVYNYTFSQLNIAQSPIVPNPTRYIVQNNFVEIESEIKIGRINFPLDLEEYYSKLFQELYGIKLVITDDHPLVTFSSITNVPENSYTINVNGNIRITFSSESSKMFALNSLVQLVQKNENNWKIQYCFVDDSPKYAWRGMHLDVSRHFFTVSEIKKILDLMAFYKLNKFHWHLTDDQGWRIEIKQFPKLTSIGAWRDSTVIGHANSKPYFYDKTRTGGFYSQDQIKDLVKYAKDRNIEVIPEIEMPGHARAALAAYPEYSCTGQQLGVEGLWGVFDDIYCSKKETIDFNKRILDEVIGLFPSNYIHIGGDEAPKTRWKNCVKCQLVITENHLKDEHELQSYFIKQIDEYLTSKGKKIIGWDEILEGGLSPNATVMSWRGEQGGIEAAKQHHDVIMSPSGYCYFDHYQSNSSTEPLAIGGFLPLEKVYLFDPTPSVLNYDEQHFILGGQANLWTEYISNTKQLEYMIFPRLLALSQVLWSYEKPNYSNFANEVSNHQFNLLNSLKVNYSKAILYPSINIFRTDKGIGLTISSLTKDEVFDVELLKTIYLKKTKSNEIKLTQKDTLFFDRTNSKIKFDNTILTIKSNYLKKPLRYEIFSDETIGLPIEFKTSPSVKFNNRGDLALVDGIRGTRPWRGDEWLGFDQDTIQFIVDLKKIKRVKKVNLGFLMANGSWIYIPKMVEILCSKDGEIWTKSYIKNASEYFTIKLKEKARFVKIQVVSESKIKEGMPGEGFHPWTFIDEIEIK